MKNEPWCESLRERALFELGRGNSVVSSVTAARLSREMADELLDYIALLETDQLHPSPEHLALARLLRRYPDLKPRRGGIAQPEGRLVRGSEYISVQVGLWRSLWGVLRGARLREWQLWGARSVEALLDDEDYAVMAMDDEQRESHSQASPQ